MLGARVLAKSGSMSDSQEKAVSCDIGRLVLSQLEFLTQLFHEFLVFLWTVKKLFSKFFQHTYRTFYTAKFLLLS